MIAKVHGFKFLITNPNDYIQRHWINQKFYEGTTLDYIKDNYRGGNFIDIGSHIGNHSIFFSQIANTVYSFEPVLQSFNAQIENIKLNQIKNILVFQCALGNKTRMVGLIHNISNMGNTHVIEEDYIDKADEFTLMYKLDEFNLKNIKVIKIDVEGYELEVLKGAEQTLQNNNADLFIECFSKSKLKEAIKFLNKLDNYTLTKLTFPSYLEEEFFYETVFLFKKRRALFKQVRA